MASWESLRLEEGARQASGQITQVQSAAAPLQDRLPFIIESSLLVKSAKDYHWSSYRSFYSHGDDPLGVDHDWWWPEDSDKFSAAMKQYRLKQKK